MTLLVGSLAGLLVSVVFLVVGLRAGDRWITGIAGVAVVAFLAAAVLLGVL